MSTVICSTCQQETSVDDAIQSIVIVPIETTEDGSTAYQVTDEVLYDCKSCFLSNLEQAFAE